MSGGVGGLAGAIPSARPDRNWPLQATPSVAAAQSHICQLIPIPNRKFINGNAKAAFAITRIMESLEWPDLLLAKGD